MPSLERAIEHAVTLIGGGMAVAIFQAWRESKREKAKEPAELLASLSELGESLSGGARDVMDELRKELKFLRGRIVDLQLEVDRGHVEIARLNDELALSRNEHADCRRELSLMRLELAERLNELPLLPFSAGSAS